MRAAELGAFLRSRRQRADPVAAGFPPDRRRTPGLRREELAVSAGVTVSWLTKLEQGQARAVSADVLGALARALRLSGAERAHLFALAGYRTDDHVTPESHVTAALRTLVDQLDPNPAYLLDRCWAIVAWNDAEARLFPKLADLAGTTPNLLELVFLDDDLGRLMADHDEELRRLVAQLRVHRDDWPDDADLGAVIERLRSGSAAFASLWDARDVSPFTATRRRFDHPVAGLIELDHHRLAVLDQPGMQLVVYTAPEGSDAIARLGATRGGAG